MNQIKLDTINQIKNLRDQCYDEKKLTLFVSSYNVNAVEPGNSLNNDWLGVDSNPPDIYAIGFQEVENHLSPLYGTPHEEFLWTTAIRDNLHFKAQYVRIEQILMSGILLNVYIKKELEKYVKNVSKSKVGTGIIGREEFNGAGLIRFDLFETSFCFINCHLEPHVHELKKRNHDYNEICRRAVFNLNNKLISLDDHDIVYWIGDFNYRLNSLSPSEVKDIIKQGKHESLIKYDQLKEQQKLGKAFANCNEGEIKFLPTYKYDNGTDTFDTSYKNRAPAYCDRILWTGNTTKCIQYRSHPKLLVSDHKPVSALLETQIKILDQEKHQKAQKEIKNILEENDCKKLEVSINKNQINFNKLSFYEIFNDNLIIENTCLIDLNFEFIINSSTLKVLPNKGSLFIGEKKKINIEIFVDQSSVSKLTSGKEKLDQILTLRLNQTNCEVKDILIPINGNYVPSSFGSSLENLIQDKEIPKELELLVNKVYESGLGVDGTFKKSALNDEFRLVREALDTLDKNKLDDQIISTITTSILIFLDSLSEPIIPYKYYEKAISNSNDFNLCKKIIDELPKIHSRVFYYLIEFIKKVIKHNKRLNSKYMAKIFSHVMLKSNDQKDAKSIESQNLFLHQFLIN